MSIHKHTQTRWPPMTDRFYYLKDFFFRIWIVSLILIWFYTQLCVCYWFFFLFFVLKNANLNYTHPRKRKKSIKQLFLLTNRPPDSVASFHSFVGGGGELLELCKSVVHTRDCCKMNLTYWRRKRRRPSGLCVWIEELGEFRMPTIDWGSGKAQAVLDVIGSKIQDCHTPAAGLSLSIGRISWH